MDFFVLVPLIYLAAVTVPLVVTDVRTRRLPNALVVPGLVLLAWALLGVALRGPPGLPAEFGGAAVGASAPVADGARASASPLSVLDGIAVGGDARGGAGVLDGLAAAANGGDARGGLAGVAGGAGVLGGLAGAANGGGALGGLVGFAAGAGVLGAGWAVGAVGMGDVKVGAWLGGMAGMMGMLGRPELAADGLVAGGILAGVQLVAVLAGGTSLTAALIPLGPALLTAFWAAVAGVFLPP